MGEFTAAADRIDFIGIGSAKSGSIWVAKALQEVARKVLVLLRYLGLRRFFLWSPVGGAFYRAYAKINLTHEAYPPLDAKLRVQLTRYYRSGVESLEKLIQRDLSRWKRI